MSLTHKELRKLTQEEVEEKFELFQFDIQKELAENIYRSYYTRDLPSQKNILLDLSEEAKKLRELLHDFYTLVEVISDEPDKSVCPQNCSDCVSASTQYINCITHVMSNLFPGQMQNSDDVEIASFTGKGASPLLCDSCYVSQRCPKFNAGSTCKFDFTGDIDFTDTETAFALLINAQKERVLRGLTFERMDGGVPDKNVSSEISHLMGMLSMYENRQNQSSFSLKIEGQAQGGGGGGMLDKMLSNLFEKKDKKEPKKLTEESSLENVRQITVEDAKVKIDVDSRDNE